MEVQYAVGLPTVGEFGDVATLVELAVTAERHGWNGVHLWDHILYHQPDWPVVSSIVTAAAIAAVTDRLRVILTLALPRRQAQDIAQDTAGIAALSGGRLTIVATIGSMDREYSEFGLDPEPRARGQALDARLAQLASLWPEPIPVWCGARWPRKIGLRRAARHAGAMPTFEAQRSHNVPVTAFAAAASFVQSLAPAPIDIALEGATDPHTAHDQIHPYTNHGLTWWIESLGWWRGGLTAGRARITAGPPR